MAQVASGELAFDTVPRWNEVPHCHDPSIVDEHVDFLGNGLDLMHGFADGSIAQEIDVDARYSDRWVDFVDLFDDRRYFGFIRPARISCWGFALASVMASCSPMPPWLGPVIRTAQSWVSELLERGKDDTNKFCQ